MPFDVKNVRSLITYYQDDEPADAQTGDVWFRPSDRRAYVRTTQGTWKRHLLKLTAGYGYVCGGGTCCAETTYSTIERFSYPMDGGVASVVGSILFEAFTTATNSSLHGYTAGGAPAGTQAISTICRFSFPDATDLVANTYLSVARCSYDAGTNSSQCGYICGGNICCSSTAYSVVDRFTFPFHEGTCTHVGDLTWSGCCATSCSSSISGYVCGGNNSTDDSQLSTVDKFTFPFDSGVASHTANLSGPRRAVSSCSSSTHGYVIGGWFAADTNVYLSIIERFSFPFDSGTSLHVGNLVGERYAAGSCSSSSGGYVCNGGLAGSIIERFPFPFDSGTSVVAGYTNLTRLVSPSCSNVDPHLRW